jgi:hypothetical protein
MIARIARRLLIVMLKLQILSSATLALVMAIATPPATAGQSAPTPCVHTGFRTDLIHQACVKGGQPEAANAMKAFMKQKKMKSCNQCHTNLAPRYDLKADGLEQFQKTGGK